MLVSKKKKIVNATICCCDKCFLVLCYLLMKQLLLTLFSVKDMADTGKSIYNPIIVARLGDISLDSVVTVHDKYNQISIQVTV